MKLEKQEKTEKTSLWKELLSFILALVIIPILFAGGCISVVSSMAAISPMFSMYLGLIYSSIFCAICIWVMNKTQNIGIKIAIGLYTAIILFILISQIPDMMPRR